MRKRLAILALILLLGFLIRAYPLFLGSQIGPDPHFHYRMAGLWLEDGGKPVFDALSLQGRFYTYAPLYHLLFSLLQLSTRLGLSFLILFFPVIYGIVGIALVYVFARKIFGEKIALFAALALSVMGMHIIRTYSYARPDGLALLFVPAAIYLLFIKKFRAAALLSIALVLLHPLSTLYLLGFVLVWAAVGKLRGKRIAAKKMLALAAIVTMVFALWLFTQPYNIGLYMSFISFESSELSQMGFIGFFSFFTFSWLFVIIGFLKMRENLFLKTWLLYSVAFSFIGLRLAIFLSIPAAIMAGFGLMHLYGKVKHRKIFFTLVFLLALFSVLPHIAGINKTPLQGELAAMDWLSTHSGENASIAAQWDQGHLLTRFAGRKVIIDGYFEFAPGLNERNESVNILARTSDCGKIETEARRFGANYFFVPHKALSYKAYKNGILEARDCYIMSGVFENDHTKIFEYTT